MTSKVTVEAVNGDCQILIHTLHLNAVGFITGHRVKFRDVPNGTKAEIYIWDGQWVEVREKTSGVASPPSRSGMVGDIDVITGSTPQNVHSKAAEGSVVWTNCRCVYCGASLSPRTAAHALQAIVKCGCGFTNVFAAQQSRDGRPGRRADDATEWREAPGNGYSNEADSQIYYS